VIGHRVIQSNFNATVAADVSRLSLSNVIDGTGYLPPYVGCYIGERENGHVPAGRFGIQLAEQG
jgi:hypothetical protein